MPTLLLLALVVSAGAAHASLGLLPTTVTGPALDATAVGRGVEDAARSVLKEGLVVLGGDALAAEGPGCLESAPCRARGIARLGVEELARLDLEGTGQPSPFATARLTVWGTDGAVAFMATQPLVTDRDLRGLLLRAFDPALATARLDVTGLLPGEVLLVDGLPTPTESLLAAGPHTLVVIHDDGSRSTEAVTLAFDERRTVSFPRRPPPGEVVWPAGLLVGVVGGGVGVVGLAGAGALAVVAAGGAPPPQGDVARVGAAVAGALGILGVGTAIVALWPASNVERSPSDRPPAPEARP